MLIREYIQAKTNVEILIRRRGKLVGRREEHNIFVNLGRQHLAYRIGGEILTYVSQMGVGIGGFRQNNPMVDLSPLTDYPVIGAHSQTDTDVTALKLERPVRVDGASGWPPLSTDHWLKSSAAPTHPTSNKTLFTCIYTEAEISYGTYATVPISEIGLFLNDKDTHVRDNEFVAYNAYDPIAKTTAIELEVRWTIIF